MEYNGFEVYPVGKAKLTIDDGVLKVSEISDSGLDGVLIKTEGVESCVVNFGLLDCIVERRGVLKTQTLVKNSFGMVVPNFETFKWYDQDADKVIFGYNAGLLPKSYKFVGTLNGETVFDFDNGDLDPADPDFPLPPPISALWGVVIGLLGVAATVFVKVYSKTKTTTTANYNSQGRLLGYTVVTEEDPIPFEVEVNGQTYTVNEVGIRYTMDLPEELVGQSSAEYSNVGEQITGTNLSEFTITSIERR